MKRTKKFGLIAALLFTIILSGMTVLAAETKCSSCGAVLSSGAEAHNASHNLDFAKLDEEYHYPVCFSCYFFGHEQDCPIVARKSEKSKHRFETTIEGITATKKCKDCDYEESYSVCKHANVTYVVQGEKHLKKCTDCKIELGTEKHTWSSKPTVPETNSYGYHEFTCTVCKTTKLVEHNFKTTYTQYPQKKDYLSMGNTVYRAALHNWSAVCTECGYHQQSNIGYSDAHTFKGNTCTKCGFKKIILSKPKGAKGKQTKKVKIKKGTSKAYTKYDSAWHKWTYYPAKKYVDRYYTVKISWKKVKGASGYLVTDIKQKVGDPATAAFAGNATKKTSLTVKPVGYNKKLKSKTYYVYPINADSILGNPAKVKVKLKN